MIGIEFKAPRSLGLRAAWIAAETAQKGLFAELIVMALMRDHRILTQWAAPTSTSSSCCRRSSLVTKKWR